MKRHSPLTDAERFPLMTETGRARLQYLREHPSAPLYNHPCGDQLDAAMLQTVQQFAENLTTTPRDWQLGTIPAWLHDFAAARLHDTPFYRQRGGSADDFFSLPTTDRTDLARAPWAFVPDSQTLDELVVYDTSGTSGAPMLILSDPTTSASYLPALRWALARAGVKLDAQPDSAATLALVAAHENTFTYATVMSYWEEAGFLKISLHPNAWRAPEDCVKFLNDCAPQIYAGDPVSLAQVAELPLNYRPQALISSAAALSPALQTQLTEHFGCPVLDVYSMNETRFIAVRLGAELMWEIVPHDLYVEILDEAGQPCPLGVRGEITVSGGRNPFLPLLRYRTGDYAALDLAGEIPRLIDLAGRNPVSFRAADGRIVPSLAVNQTLRQFPLTQFALHQTADSALTLQLRPSLGVSRHDLEKALRELFGAAQKLTIEDLPADSKHKIRPFSSAVS